MELSERKKRILSAIVEEYIMTGEPVGSKYLAASGIGLSSATIRNEMAELAALGFITQPHTSAGRIPTHLGYRIYVDSLMENYSLTPEERKRFDPLKSVVTGDIETTLEKAGNILSDITGCASLSTVPDNNIASIRHIDVMPAGSRSLLLVMLTNSGVIKSCILRIEEDVTSDMVEFFSHLLNDNFNGKKLETITQSFIDSIKNQLFEYKFALSPVLDTIFDEIRSVAGEVLVGGTANLLSSNELTNEQVVEIMNFIHKRSELLRMIDGIANGVQVRIGAESGLPFMDNSTIIAAPYAFKGKICGTVGIIGPTRINYPKMVSSIKYFANNLSKLINDSFGD